MHPVAKGVIARMFSFVPTVFATLIASRLILTHFGVAAFDGYTVAESLIVLLPLGDLGVGSAITAAFASHDPTGREVQGVMLTATRITVLAALFLSALALAMSAAGLWTTALGSASYGGGFFGLAMVCYAVGFVPGLGQAMLLGVHRYHLTILVQSLIRPGVLAGVVLLVLLKGNSRWVVVLPAASLAVVNLVTSVVASRVTGFSWRGLVRKVARRGTYKGSRIRSIAGPRLILSITLPLALASDRVVLSHFASVQDVAVYGVCMQIFAPVMALIVGAGQPLWPIYVAARATGKEGPRVTLLLLGFCGATVLASGMLIAFSRPIAAIVSDGKVHLGGFVPFAGGLMTLAFAAAYPVSTALTTPKELRFMAAVNLIALPVNLALSIVLARSIGAVGPMLASTGIGLGMTTAGVYYLRTRPRERYVPLATEPVPTL